MSFNTSCPDCLSSGYICKLHTPKHNGVSEGLPEAGPNQLGLWPYKPKSRCECGSQAVGYADYTKFHSFWCPAWKKD